MHLSMSGSTWLMVIGAAAAAWLFGAIYYMVLSRAWLAAQGRTMGEMKIAHAHTSTTSTTSKAFPFVLSLLAEILMAAVMSGLLTHMGVLTLRGGMISAFLIWAGFVLTTNWVNNAYPGRSTLLTCIDAGHWLGVLLIIGAIIGGLG